MYRANRKEYQGVILSEAKDLSRGPLRYLVEFTLSETNGLSMTDLELPATRCQGERGSTMGSPLAA